MVIRDFRVSTYLLTYLLKKHTLFQEIVVGYSSANPISVVESQLSKKMKVGKGSGEDSVEEKEKDLDPSSNLLNVRTSRNFKSLERRNDATSLKKETIKNTNRYAMSIIVLCLSLKKVVVIWPTIETTPAFDY